MAQGKKIQQVAVTDFPAKAGGSIRFIELNRPEKLNCLSLEMLNELLAALQNCGSSNYVVLTGAGRSFCAGLDFNEIGGPEGATSDSAGKHLQLLVSIYRWFLTAKIPTLALARGYAAGGGAGLVAAAKSAVVSADFRCRLPGGNLARLATVAVPLFHFRTAGKLPSDMGLFGREFGVEEAQRMGLVDKIVSPVQLNDAILAIKEGDLSPDWIGNKRRDKHKVAEALDELDRVLQTMKICKPE